MRQFLTEDEESLDSIRTYLRMKSPHSDFVAEVELILSGESLSLELPFNIGEADKVKDLLSPIVRALKALIEECEAAQVPVPPE